MHSQHTQLLHHGSLGLRLNVASLRNQSISLDNGSSDARSQAAMSQPDMLLEEQEEEDLDWVGLLRIVRFWPL